MELPPFNFPNPLGYFGGVKQVTAKLILLIFNISFVYMQRTFQKEMFMQYLFHAKKG